MGGLYARLCIKYNGLAYEREKGIITGSSTNWATVSLALQSVVCESTASDHLAAC